MPFMPKRENAEASTTPSPSFPILLPAGFSLRPSAPPTGKHAHPLDPARTRFPLLSTFLCFKSSFSGLMLHSFLYGVDAVSTKNSGLFPWAEWWAATALRGREAQGPVPEAAATAWQGKYSPCFQKKEEKGKTGDESVKRILHLENVLHCHLINWSIGSQMTSSSTASSD